MRLKPDTTAFLFSIQKGFSICSRRFSFLLPALLIFLALISVPGRTSSHNHTANGENGQFCMPSGEAGDASFSFWLTDSSTGAVIAPGSVVKSWTNIKFNNLATAYGECQLYACADPSCTACAPTEIQRRGVADIRYWMDQSSFEGRIYTVEPGTFTVINPQVFDTNAPNTTGPVTVTLYRPGKWTFYSNAGYYRTACGFPPGRSDAQSITIYAVDDVEPINYGCSSCNASVGEPINVTTGNTFLTQTDIDLPGLGDGLKIARYYNSRAGQVGVFGYNWWSKLDINLTSSDSRLFRLDLEDASAVYFIRNDENSPFSILAPRNFHGQLDQNSGGDFTLTFSSGEKYQFTPAGRLSSTSDRNNNTTTYTRNVDGKVTALTDASGRSLSLSYRANGIIEQISDASGILASYTHDWFRQNVLEKVVYADDSEYTYEYLRSPDYYSYRQLLTSIKDRLGNVIESHTYDSSDRALTSERHGGVEKYSIEYVSATETHVTDALGRLKKYFIDRSGSRNVVTRIEGSCSCGSSETQTWTYDDDLNVTSKTDAAGLTTSYTYDANGNPLTRTDATGVTSYTWNQFGQLLTGTDPMSGVATNAYDSRGNLLTATDRAGGVASFTYDARGLPLTLTDPRNHVTQFQYDTYGNLTSRTDAFNKTTFFEYDSRNRRTKVTNALNHVTSFTYDAAGKLKTVTEPGNALTTYNYDLAGRLTSKTDARNHTTTYGYDGAYRLTTVANAANHTTSYSYDLMSNAKSVTDPLGRTTDFSYDDFDRLKTITYPPATAGATRLTDQYEYDAAGHVIKFTDRANRITTIAYDNANRPIRLTDPLSGVTYFVYNARSQRRAVIDPANQRYEMSYDPLGRMTQMRRANLTTSYIYDAAGNRTKRTDYNGETTDYAYDALNRLTTVSYPGGGGASYQYDDLSRMTTATNAHGVVTMAYDNRNRLTNVTDVWGVSIGYGYDAVGNQTQLTIGASTTNYTYNALDLLTQATHNVVGTTGFTYDAANRPTTRSLPNLVNASANLDGLDRLGRLRYEKGSTDVADFQYQFNAVDQITQLTDASGSHSFTYDALERLKTASHPSVPAETYNYDAVGNRTSSHRSANYSYQPLNRLASATGVGFTYDANGNRSTKTDASGVWQYFYDRENRLISVMTPGSAVINYKYDALGRRIERSKNGTEWTRFSYDGFDVVRDLQSDGGVVEYGHGLSIDDNVWQRKSDGTTRFFVSDHQGSTRALTDGAGAVVETLSYDSFGNPSGPSQTRFGYTGREWDDDAGLWYYRARWYDSSQGRFLSEDPIGLDGGINLYSYVANDPTNGVDPLGLKRTPSPRTGVSAGRALGRLGLAGALAYAVYEIYSSIERPKPNYPHYPAPYNEDDPDATPTPRRGPAPRRCTSLISGSVVTQSGIDQVVKHLTQTPGLEPEAPEFHMIERLRAGACTPQDLRFYEHELLEAEILEEIKHLYEDPVDAVREAHLRTLKKQNLYYRGYESELYHPDALKLIPK